MNYIEGTPRPPNNCKLKELHDYFTAEDGGAYPHAYAGYPQRGEMVARVASVICAKDEPVLELGCNIGRNLQGMLLAGYTNLSGVEINPASRIAMQEVYPELAQIIKLNTAPIESVITFMPTNSYGLVFTMTVLMHIHPDSTWIFPHIARIAKKLLTIENERADTRARWSRDYGRIFRGLGATEIYREKVSLSSPKTKYTLRLFDCEGIG